MPDCVAYIVGESTDGEGKLVSVSCVSEEIYDKIARADIVGQIRERSITERIVANILNNAPSIGIRTRVLKLG